MMSMIKSRLECEGFHTAEVNGALLISNTENVATDYYAYVRITEIGDICLIAGDGLIQHWFTLDKVEDMYRELFFVSHCISK